jgi:hypothetical protein
MARRVAVSDTEGWPSLADQLELHIRSIPGVVDVAIWPVTGSVALEVLVDEHWAIGDVEAEVGAVVERLSGRWPASMHVVGVRGHPSEAGRSGGARSSASGRVRLLAACPERWGDRLVSAVALSVAERSVEVGGEPGGFGAARATLVALRRLGLVVPYRLELVAPACWEGLGGRRTGSLIVLRRGAMEAASASNPVRPRWPERVVGAALGASEEESAARAVLDGLNRILELGGPLARRSALALGGDPIR